MPEWKERAPALEKMRTVCAHLAVALDPKVRLYLSVVKLKELRDMLAHGKPINKVFDEGVVATAEELEAQRIIDAGWEAQINHAFFSDAYADVERIWGELLTKSGLSVFETITHGTRQISFIEHVR